MRPSLSITLVVFACWGCSDATHPRAASTTVEILPHFTALDAIGATTVVHATVRDGSGAATPGVALTWSTKAANITVAGLGGDSAAVTAVANGSATITASTGSVTASAEVLVVQLPGTIRSAGGDGQTGVVTTLLPAPVRVIVTDRLGTPVAGEAVTFRVTSGGGTVSSESVKTAADGSAATTWTLGTEALGQFLAATVTNLPSVVTFRATALPGPAARLTAVSGDGQIGAVGAAVLLPPTVRVTDAYGNPVPGATVDFAVTGGGGSVTGGSATSGPDGRAAVGSWILGATPATNTLAATLAGTPAPAVGFTASGFIAVPGRVEVGPQPLHAAMAGTAVANRPSLVVRDFGGRGVPGLTVVFAVTEGDGTLTQATATTDSSGRATVGSWVLGSGAGPNRVTATVQAAVLTGNPVSWRAIGCTGGGGGGYAVTLCPLTAMTASQRAAFAGAASRWRAIVTGDLPDVDLTFQGGGCGVEAVDFTVDDLVIFPAVQPIDGNGGILGSAGWCVRRLQGLPVAGVMQFDAADVTLLEAQDQFGSVVLHEMGHVLGIGSLWTQFQLLLQAPGAPLPDVWYIGPNGINGFDAIGGASYTASHKVPVENSGGAGTAFSHWRETVLANELMTGFLNPGINPLSELTVRSLVDLGYTVNTAAADPFVLLPNLQGQAAPAGGLKLENDVWHGPQYTVDRRGLMTRIP